MNFDKESKSEDFFFFFFFFLGGGGGERGRGFRPEKRFSLFFFVLMLYIKFQVVL